MTKRVKKILFRADAKLSIGTGDLVSLFHLSEYFERGGWQAHFMIRGYPLGVDLARARGVQRVRVIEPFAALHKVAAGDTLDKIARSNKTTIELLRRINGIKGDMLRIGQNLKVVPGGFDVAVDKSDFHLTVTKDGCWVREFRIGLGKNGTTPVGEFVAGHKLLEPVYTAVFPAVPFGDKKNNPLGTRWITVTTDYGIHGTWEPETIGKEESKGCVRMANADVEWLFDLMVPGSSKIVIRP